MIIPFGNDRKTYNIGIYLCIFIFYVCVSLPAYICAPYESLVIQKSDGIKPLKIGVIGCSELPCVCWESNCVPLEEQPES